MSGITTHVLDTASGRPAQGMGIVLFRQTGDEWKEMASGRTDADGRLRDLLPKGAEVERGIYKLRFATKEYFAGHGIAAALSMDVRATVTLYPCIEIIFEIAGDEHYHVPLLLSPFGYSTYRGS